jgi:DNA-binding CsgD family transcriptional regulator
MPSPDLSDRELTVARLLAAGRTRTDIAMELQLSRHTIDSHVQNAFRKTGLETEEQLILWLQGGSQ